MSNPVLMRLRKGSSILVTKKGTTETVTATVVMSSFKEVALAINGAFAYVPKNATEFVCGDCAYVIAQRLKVAATLSDSVKHEIAQAWVNGGDFKDVVRLPDGGEILVIVRPKKQMKPRAKKADKKK